MSGNPCADGSAALLPFRGRERELPGAEPVTSNHRMGLLAAIEALATLSRNRTVELASDWQYVCDGTQRWLVNWRTAKQTAGQLNESEQ